MSAFLSLFLVRAQNGAKLGMSFLCKTLQNSLEQVNELIYITDEHIKEMCYAYE